MKKKNNIEKEYREVYNSLYCLDIVNKSILPLVAAGTASSFLLGPVPIIASATISGSAVLISYAMYKKDSSLHRRYTKLQSSKKIDDEEKQNLSVLMDRLQNT